MEPQDIDPIYIGLKRLTLIRLRLQLIHPKRDF